MREHKANSGPAGPEASKKGWEGPSLPRLGRKGKIVRNLLLTAVFAACIWGQYGCPLPTAELNFRRLEHKYLMEPSQIVFSQSGERDFQAEDGTWLSLSRTAVVGVGEEWMALGYNQRVVGAPAGRDSGVLSPAVGTDAGGGGLRGAGGGGDLPGPGGAPGRSPL